MPRKLPLHVVRDRSRHGKIRYYFRRGLGQRVRLPDPESPHFWPMYKEVFAGEVLGISEPVTEDKKPSSVVGGLDYEKAKFPRRRKSTRVGVMTFDQYLIEILRSSRTRARKKEVPYDISLDYIKEMAREQGYCCALTGIPFFTYAQANSRIPPFVPSIDRIYPERGYVRGNVRLVCFAVNAMMLDWGEEVFRHVARQYHAFKYLTSRGGNSAPDKSSTKSTTKEGVLRSRRIA
jgi:hypothetical protein